MRWQIKWAKNAAFGLLPFSGTLRRMKRRLRPYQTTIASWTLEEGLRQVDLLREVGCELRGAQILEVGTGWQPIIPLLFSLAGASRVVMIDSQRLMDAHTFGGTVQNLVAHAPLISSRLGIDEGTIRDELAKPTADLNSLLQKFRLEYSAPCELSSFGLEKQSFDVITSRAVLEHVPPAGLTQLLGSVLHLLKPGGWTCHAIDNSDHWSHNDKRISRVNFLRYSDRWFNFLNRFNPLDYQNRLRHSEYEAMFLNLGFEIVISRSDPEPKALAELKTLPLAPRFQEFKPEDLASLDSYFVARRPLLE